MWYLDLDELPAVIATSKLLSATGPSWLKYSRSDYFGDANLPLKTAVIKNIVRHSDVDEQQISRVCMLTNLRTLGFLMNPVTFYYAFDANDRLLVIMPEITNTPWNERYSYVLAASEDAGGTVPTSAQRGKYRYQLNKSFHISPFHPMNMQYDWRFKEPNEKHLFCHLENWQTGMKIFDATLSLTPQAITAGSVRTTLIRFPVMTVTVAVGIYWNALKLWLKGVPYHSHPKGNNKEKLL